MRQGRNEESDCAGIALRPLRFRRTQRKDLLEALFLLYSPSSICDEGTYILT